jgi:8-oxo-dGTP pyrophosphatase MutT (NUDIX family)
VIASVIHPRRDDAGHPVIIRRPSVASPLSTWGAPAALAVVVPDGPVPAALHGIPLAPAAFRPGRLIAVAEPPFSCPSGLKPAAGVVIEEPEGRVWVVHPSNGFAGYKATFPKGTVDHGGSLQETAIREAWEESGLLVELVSWLIDVPRTQSFTRYYRARRVGGSPAAMGWETQAVALVPKDQLIEHLNQAVDHQIVAALNHTSVDEVRRAGSGRPHLGDAQVVGAYVRGFVAGIVERAAAVGAGTMSREDAVAADRRACVDGADVFLGKNPAFTADGQWNRGGGLVAWMFSALSAIYAKPSDKAAPDLIVADAFALCVRKVYEAVTFHAEHDYGDDALQDDLAAIADDFTKFLFGVPGMFEQHAAMFLSR